ncbi:MAG: hypothetical protein ABIT05_16335 [Chitinophagaceae bacterium]
MKIKTLIIALLCMLSISQLQAQHVSVRLNFPGGVRAGHGPSPYAGAIWIGPEWQWRSGTYVAVPGYWAKPQRHRAIWVPGYWKYSRYGYRWVPGYWR